MEQMLPPGTVLGRRHRGYEVAGFILTEARFAAKVALPPHAHENAFFRLIVAGASTDICAGRSVLGEAASMVYHAAGETHANCWHRSGRSFVIELPVGTVQRVGEPARALQCGRAFPSGPAVQLGLRAFGEFERMDAVSPLVLEGLILELIAVACRSAIPRSGPTPPSWLRRTRDRLKDCFATTPGLGALAADVGVHPGHLVRAFRQHYHCTPGEYVRQLRVERACCLLGQGTMSLAEVALTTGFADQSHFSTIFKRHTGLTPAGYRRAVRAR
jgi:AraC family transcriptional regulator